MFLWNILLALAWSALNGEFSIRNLLIGLVLGYVILSLMVTADVVGSRTYARRVSSAARMLVFFVWELLLANLRVAHDVLTPRHRMRPGIVAIPLDAKTDPEIVFLATLITLTPGTITLDVSDDRSVMYIHAMYIDDLDALRRGIKDGFERRALEVLR
jgi:multicomponent Na+:H+ antiporter subunit E